MAAISAAHRAGGAYRGGRRSCSAGRSRRLAAR
jgi:hypothetical protein